MKTRKRQGFIKLLVLAVVLGAGLYGALSFHVVRNSSLVRSYPKATLTLKDSFVDFSGMSVADLKNHKELVAIVLKSGDYQLLPKGETLNEFYKAGLDVNMVIDAYESEEKFMQAAQNLKNKVGSKFDELKQIGKDAQKNIQETGAKLKDIFKR
jgi:hypothetical protein